MNSHLDSWRIRFPNDAMHRQVSIRSYPTWTILCEPANKSLDISCCFASFCLSDTGRSMVDVLERPCGVASIKDLQGDNPAAIEQAQRSLTNRQVNRPVRANTPVRVAAPSRTVPRRSSVPLLESFTGLKVLRVGWPDSPVLPPISARAGLSVNPVRMFWRTETHNALRPSLNLTAATTRWGGIGSETSPGFVTGRPISTIV